ncbi:creatininase family protein [Mycobacterium lepromatosis]|uniref:creatininase family protein n=1 Tax=Mycobacterium lepromatosis TaxID=480418 RepID=UPI001F3851C1|nr:creatininase family protein [Mycobacterium lepromatosis]
MILPESTKQHGPNLPVDTDTRITIAVARGPRVEEHMTHVEQAWPAAPAFAYGANGEHQSFSGTISIGTEVLTALLVEYSKLFFCWGAASGLN